MLECVSVPSRLGSEPTAHVQGVQAECTLPVWCLEPQEELERLRGTDPAFCDQSASSTTGPWTVVSSMTIPHNRAMRGLSCSISSPLLSERKVAESPLPSSCPLSCSILSSKVLKAGTYVPRCQDIRMQMRLVAGRDWWQIPIQVPARDWGAHTVLGADF